METTIKNLRKAFDAVGTRDPKYVHALAIEAAGKLLSECRQFLADYVASNDGEGSNDEDERFRAWAKELLA